MGRRREKGRERQKRKRERDGRGRGKKTIVDTFGRRHEAPAEAQRNRREARDHEPDTLQWNARLLDEAELPREAGQVMIEEHHVFEGKGFEVKAMATVERVHVE